MIYFSCSNEDIYRTFESMLNELDRLHSSSLTNLTETYKKERSENLLHAMWFRYPEECANYPLKRPN